MHVTCCTTANIAQSTLSRILMPAHFQPQSKWCARSAFTHANGLNMKWKSRAIKFFNNSLLRCIFHHQKNEDHHREQTKSFWKNLWIASNATEVNASAHFIRVIVFHLFLSHSNSTYIYQPTFKSRNFAQEQRNCWNSTCASTFSNFIS